MRKINHYLGAIAVAGLSLGFAACSSEDIVEPDAPNSNVERTVYVNVAIHGDAAEGSRASETDGNPVEGDTDFADGTGTESAVQNVYLVFYDNSGNVVGDIVNIPNPTFEKTPAPSGTVEEKHQQAVAVTLSAGQDNPTQVMCYINPANPADLQNPLATVQTIERDNATINGTSGTLFPMSNSVYYGVDGELKMAVQIPATAVFYSLEDANAELNKTDNAQIIDIYVERYATKLQVTGFGTIKPYTTATTKDGALGTDAAAEVPVVLTFNVDGWTVNGESKTTFAVKSFREASTTGQILPDNLTYELLNSRINAQNATYDPETGVITAGQPLTTGPWTWNNASYHRSYWACSPVYFQAEYPEVLSDYIGNANSKQIFRSYNDAVEAGKETGYRYYKETTSGIPALRSKNPNAAIPSVILVGHYTMSVDGTEVTEFEGRPTFYTYVATKDGKPSVYFTVDQTNESNRETAASAISGGISMQKRFIWQTTVLYKNTAAEGATPNFVRMSAADENDLKAIVSATSVVRPADNVLGDVKFASRARTLQINADANLSELYINNNGTPMQIVANGTTITPDETGKVDKITLDDANRILWQNVGTCNQYERGAGFFNIPVKHLGWYRTGNEQKNETENIDYSKLRIGDFGMVRNHAYTITIDEINGLAAGIAGLDNPIIPPADTQEIYIAYRINVLRWAVVPTQNVTLN